MRNYNFYTFEQYEKIDFVEAMENIREAVRANGPISIVNTMRHMIPEFADKKATEFAREYAIFTKAFGRLVCHGILVANENRCYTVSEVDTDLNDIAHFGVTVGAWMPRSLHDRLKKRLKEEHRRGRKWSMSTLICQMIEKGFQEE